MRFRGKGFDFELGKKTYIMGILNVTPDSFFDGGLYNDPQSASDRAVKMLQEGADIIDIGAQSTRPGHKLLSQNEELEIIKSYLPLIYEKTGAVISVDTFYPEVAAYAALNGAAVVNDVSGIFNPQMAQTVRKYGMGWVITHTGGGNSDTVREYSGGVTADIIDFFESSLEKCGEYGISRENIALDIGIGFGKTYEQNIEALKNLNVISQSVNCAVLTALSAKRMVAEATGVEGYDRVYGTVAANTAAVAGGTDILRVHHIKENALAAKMADALYRL